MIPEHADVETLFDGLEKDSRRLGGLIRLYEEGRDVHELEQMLERRPHLALAILFMMHELSAPRLLPIWRSAATFASSEDPDLAYYAVSIIRYLLPDIDAEEARSHVDAVRAREPSVDAKVRAINEAVKARAAGGREQQREAAATCAARRPRLKSIPRAADAEALFEWVAQAPHRIWDVTELYRIGRDIRELATLLEIRPELAGDVLEVIAELEWPLMLPVWRKAAEFASSDEERLVHLALGIAESMLPHVPAGEVAACVAAVRLHNEAIDARISRVTEGLSARGR